MENGSDSSPRRGTEPPGRPAMFSAHRPALARHCPSRARPGPPARPPPASRDGRARAARHASRGPEPAPRTCSPRWAARPGSGARAAAPASAPLPASPAARSASEAAPAASWRWRRRGPGAWTRRWRRGRRRRLTASASSGSGPGAATAGARGGAQVSRGETASPAGLWHWGARPLS